MKLIRIIFLFTLFVLSSTFNTYAQSQPQSKIISVALQEYKGDARQGVLFQFYSLNEFCDSSTIKIPAYLRFATIKQADIQRIQKNYSEMKRGLMSKEYWQTYTAYFADFEKWFNPMHYLEKPTRQAVKILIGLNDKDELVVIPDSNNDCDFLNDTATIIRYSANGISKDIEFSTSFSGVEWVNKGEIKHISIQAQILVEERSFKSVVELSELLKRNDWIYLVDRSTMNGGLTIGGKFFKAFVKSSFSKLPDPTHDNEIFFCEEHEPLEIYNVYLKRLNNQFFIPGDTLLLNHHYLRIHSISEYYDTLYLQDLKLSSATGYRTGFYSPSFSAKTIEGKKFNYPGQSPGKYLFIDFWGTWCIPCRELMPEWKKIQLAMKNKPVQFLGVAADKPEDSAKVKKEIREFKRQGLHVHENRPNFFDRSPSIVNTYKAGCFPTYILIAPNGEILVRGCGKETLAEIKALLMKRLQ